MTIEQRPAGLVKLTGTIENYKVTRTEASFMFTDTDRTKLGVIAIAAGIARLSGPATSTAAYAASAEEDAHGVGAGVHSAGLGIRRLRPRPSPHPKPASRHKHRSRIPYTSTGNPLGGTRPSCGSVQSHWNAACLLH